MRRRFRPISSGCCWLVVSRPLLGDPPTIDFVIGYRPDISSPIRRTFLASVVISVAAEPAGQKAKTGQRPPPDFPELVRRS